jgi:ABC-type phosphate transport system substrate-binding protein
VRVFVLPDADTLHRTFVKQTLELYPRQLRRVWDRHLFSGAGAVPVTVSSAEEMLQRVSETPGAVGYLPDGYAGGTLRVIHVQQ